MSNKWLDYVIDHKTSCEKAKADGFEVIYGSTDRLLIDLDSTADIAEFDRRFEFAKIMIPMEVEDRWYSKSGVGEHIVIKLQEPLEIAERTLLEAILGSDLFRAFFIYFKNFKKEKIMNPSALFKPTKKKREEWAVTEDDVPF